MDYILNLLPVTEEERTQFEAIAPDATQMFARRTTVTAEMVAEATVIMGWPRLDDVANAPNLRWLHCMWAGLDEYVGKVDFPDGCRISGSAGTNAQSVSEHMLASLLTLCRRLPEAVLAQSRHEWVSIMDMKTLDGATVLILGAGNIGRRFGKLCQAMGSHTIGLQRTPAPAPDGLNELYTMDRLDDLLPSADVVALCLPQSPATDNIISEARIAKMRDGAILMNAGRGNAVDQAALICALQSGKLWGCALDVTSPEPLPADDPLWDAPNLLITPHVAGGLRIPITRDNIIALAQKNLRSYLAGDPLINEMV